MDSDWTQKQKKNKNQISLKAALYENVLFQSDTKSIRVAAEKLWNISNYKSGIHSAT